MELYSSPFSRGYWRAAAAEMKDLRKLLFAALMIAACLILSRFKIPLGESLSLNITFLARALCSLVCGPVVAVVFAVAEDTISFFLNGVQYDLAKDDILFINPFEPHSAFVSNRCDRAVYHAVNMDPNLLKQIPSAKMKRILDDLVNGVLLPKTN